MRLNLLFILTDSWYYRVAMNKRLKRRSEIIEKEKKHEADRKKGPFAALRRLSIFNRKKDKDKDKNKSAPSSQETSPSKTPIKEKDESESARQTRPTTANSSTQTARSILRKIPPPSSPTKSSMKKPGSQPGSPNKSPKRVTLMTQRDAEYQRQAKEEEFVAIEMTPTVPSEPDNKKDNNNVQIHYHTSDGNIKDPVKVSTDEVPKCNSLKINHAEGDTFSNFSSLDEFDFVQATKSDNNGKQTKNASDMVVVDMEPAEDKNSATKSAIMEKYIRPPTRDTSRLSSSEKSSTPHATKESGDPVVGANEAAVASDHKPSPREASVRPVTANKVSRPITAGGASSSRKPERPKTATKKPKTNTANNAAGKKGKKT